MAATTVAAAKQQMVRPGTLAVFRLASDGPPAARNQVATSSQQPGDGPVEYDPLSDPVPLPQAPKGARPEWLMSHLTYVGAVGRINASEGRGGTREEIATYAKKAGYADGKAVNGWNSRLNSPRAIENIDGMRYLNSQGHEWVLANAEELGTTLRRDLTLLPIPKRY